MYTTDTHIALPLPFFQNKHLRYIIDYGATLSTIKSNPKEGETKGAHILDVTKITINFGAKTTIEASGMKQPVTVTNSRCQGTGMVTPDLTLTGGPNTSNFSTSKKTR